MLQTKRSKHLERLYNRNQNDIFEILADSLLLNSDCHELKSFKWYKYNYAPFHKQANDLIMNYFDLTSSYSQAFQGLSKQRDIAKIIFRKYLNPMSQAIQAENFDMANKIFQECLNEMPKHFYPLAA